jgi:hypothetical protein
MHVAIIHRDNRPWPPPRNHLDGRVCPDCGATAHGSKSQRKHREWHLKLNELATEFAKRTGLAETPFDVPWRWGADVEGQNTDAIEGEAAEG